MERTAQFLPPDASEVLRCMADAARHAGERLCDISKSRHLLAIEEKSAGDFVSQADKDAEKTIANCLSDQFPDYGWLGEEGGARPGQAGGLRWVVDPLDGTTNFLKGIPHWAVSIALCEDEHVRAAVVYDPMKQELFCAEKDAGAFLNGARIKVSDGVALRAALFGTGVPAGGRVTYLKKCLGDIERLMPLCAGVRRGGAAALDLAYVAAGRLDGYWERNLGPWDIAAGLLLVEEAGGIISQLWEARSVLSSGSFVASNGDLHAALTEQIDPVP